MIINKGNNEYTNVGKITLYEDTVLNFGTIATPGSVNGTVLSSTLLYTVPFAVDYLISNIFLNFNDVTGLTGTMSASIGTNSPNYDNMLANTPFTGFNALTHTWNIVLAGLSHKPSSGEGIYIKINTAFGGTSVYFDAVITGRVK